MLTLKGKPPNETYMSQLPICVSIPGGVWPSRFIVVDGRIPNNAVSFSVKLQSNPSIPDPGEILVWVRLYFEESHASFSVNSYVEHRMGTPIGSFVENTTFEINNTNNLDPTKGGGVAVVKYPNVPVRRGDYCGLVIECLPGCFTISVQGERLCEFVHRIPFSRARYLVLSGDWQVCSAGVGGAAPTRWLVRATGFYEPWLQNVITILSDESLDQLLGGGGGGSDESSGGKKRWAVLFYLGQCAFHKEWEAAAQELRGKMNFGVLDVLVNQDTAIRLNLRECPLVVSVSGDGWRHRYEYCGPSAAKWIVRWMLALSEGKGDVLIQPQPQPPERGRHQIPLVERDSWRCGPPASPRGSVHGGLAEVYPGSAPKSIDQAVDTIDLEETAVLQYLDHLKNISGHEPPGGTGGATSNETTDKKAGARAGPQQSEANLIAPELTSGSDPYSEISSSSASGATSSKLLTKLAQDGPLVVPKQSSFGTMLMMRDDCSQTSYVLGFKDRPAQQHRDSPIPTQSTSRATACDLSESLLGHLLENRNKIGTSPVNVPAKLSSLEHVSHHKRNKNRVCTHCTLRRVQMQDYVKPRPEHGD